MAHLTWLFQWHRHDPVIFRLGLFPIAFRRRVFHAVFLRRRRFRRRWRRLFLRRGFSAGVADHRMIRLHHVRRTSTSSASAASADAATATSGAIGRNDAAAGADAVLSAGRARECGAGAAVSAATTSATTGRNQRWTFCFCFPRNKKSQEIRDLHVKVCSLVLGKKIGRRKTKGENVNLGHAREKKLSSPSYALFGDNF